MSPHAAIAQPLQPLARWSAASFDQRSRSDAWSMRLGEVFGDCSLARRVSSTFDGWCHHRGDKAFRVVDCMSDPCSGRHIAQPHDLGDDVLGIQLVLAGREHFSIGTDRFVLEEGDVFIWDNTQNISFEVTERLHKQTIMLPLQRLRTWTPDRHLRVPKKLSATHSEGRILAAMTNSIVKEYIAGAPHREGGLADAIAALVAGLAGPNGTTSPNSRTVQLSRIKSYIDSHLTQIDLTPQQIAARTGVSLRYLQIVFEAAGETVVQYMIRQRLLLARRVLGSRRSKLRKIGDIATSCGFRNPTHFAKRFKAEFGMSPAEAMDRSI